MQTNGRERKIGISSFRKCRYVINLSHVWNKITCLDINYWKMLQTIVPMISLPKYLSWLFENYDLEIIRFHLIISSIFLSCLQCWTCLSLVNLLRVADVISWEIYLLWIFWLCQWKWFNTICRWCWRQWRYWQSWSSCCDMLSILCHEKIL